jgi:hypothetical protein
VDGVFTLHACVTIQIWIRVQTHVYFINAGALQDKD